MKGYCVILMLFVFCSCSEREQNLSEILDAWHGKEIRFPDNPIFTHFGKDTVDFKIKSYPFTILFYVDSNSCVDCKMKLSDWKQFKHVVDSLGGNVQYLFFIHNKRVKYVRNILASSNFDWPICLDSKGDLNRINRFPKDERLHAFLLDHKFRVLVVGDPLQNLQIKNLYLKNILQTNTVEPKSMTRIQIATSIIDLGEIKGLFPVYKLFNIKNIGLYPLAIANIATSCGCVQYEYDKRPVAKGGELDINFVYTPKKYGFFSETIVIHCNTSGPIKLVLKGRVKPSV